MNSSSSCSLVDGFHNHKTYQWLLWYVLFKTLYSIPFSWIKIFKSFLIQDNLFGYGVPREPSHSPLCSERSDLPDTSVPSYEACKDPLHTWNCQDFYPKRPNILCVGQVSQSHVSPLALHYTQSPHVQENSLICKNNLPQCVHNSQSFCLFVKKKSFTDKKQAPNYTVDEWFEPRSMIPCLSGWERRIILLKTESPLPCADCCWMLGCFLWGHLRPAMGITCHFPNPVRPFPNLGRKWKPSPFVTSHPILKKIP